MKVLFIAIALMGASSYANAQKVFWKHNDSQSVLLTLNESGAAKIALQLPDPRPDMILLEGSVKGSTPSITLVREQGDICPSASVEIKKYVELGKAVKVTAEVRNNFEELTEAELKFCRRYMKEIRTIEGTYEQIK